MNVCTVSEGSRLKGPETSMVSQIDENDQTIIQNIHLQDASLSSISHSSDMPNPNSLAVDSNTQNFYNKIFQKRFLDSLYFTNDRLSTEFKENMKMFHIVFTLILLNKLGLTIYNLFIQPNHWIFFIVILVFVSLFLIAQAIVYLLVVQISKFKQNIFVLYGILTFFSIIFLEISHVDVIFVENDENFKSSKQSSLVILLIILIYRDLFLNNGFLVAVQGFLGIVVHILVYIFTLKGSFIDIVSNSSLMIVGVIYIIIYSFRLDLKQKRYFAKLDNQKKISDKFAKNRNSDVNSFFSEREKMVWICNMLSFLLEQIHCMDLVIEMKTEIKSSIEQLFLIKNFIVELPVLLTEDISMMLYRSSPFLSRQPSINHDQSPPGLSEPLTKVIPDNLLKKFQKNFIKEWNFDIISLKLPNLFLLASQESLKKLNILENLPYPQKLFNLIESLEKSYQQNPYHNSLHAVDVLHSFLYLLVKCSSTATLDPIDCLCSIVAALGHDVGHPGKDNLYLKEENNELCSRFNFNSVLENMHCALIFELIRKDSCNFLDELSKTDQNHFRKSLTCLVLGTDFSTYSDTAGKLSCLVQEKKIFGCFSSDKASFIFSVALKCGDAGHYAKGTELFGKWDKLLLDEYKKLQIKDDFDFVMNEAEFISNNQRFTKDSVIPLYKSWIQFSSLLNGSHVEGLLENIENNLRYKPSFDSQRDSTTEGRRLALFA